MKALLLGFLIACIPASADEVFRVSRVVAAAGEGVERMTFKAGNREDVLFVKKDAVLNAADVQEAWAEIFPTMRGISIRLKPEAAKKLEAVTGEMSLGVERLAVFVDGKPVFAPVVQAKLSAQFIIEGFEDLMDDELKELARKIAGRPPGSPGVEKPELKGPEPKWEPYTEREYLQIKARRAKLGIYYLDTIRSAEELEVLLVKGMTRAEVMTAFGKPTRGAGKPVGIKSWLAYEIAPEKRKDEGDLRMLPDWFTVYFADGRVTGHDVNYSGATRALKKAGWEPPLLRLSAPEPDLSGESQTVLQYFESIKAEDPKQVVNITDLEDLIALVMMLEGMQVGEGPPPPVVNAGCDLILTLAHHFPEVADLREDAKDGSIPVAALCDAMSGYSSGRRPLPRSNAGDGGGGPPVKDGSK